MKYCTKFYAEYHTNTANIDSKVCWREYNIAEMESVGCIISMRDIFKYWSFATFNSRDFYSIKAFSTFNSRDFLYDQGSNFHENCWETKSRK